MDHLLWSIFQFKVHMLQVVIWASEGSFHVLHQTLSFLEYFDQLLLAARKAHVVYSDQLLGAALRIHFISNHDSNMFK